VKTKFFIVTVSFFFVLHGAFAFEGCITSALPQGGPATGLLYTAGTNFLRVETTAANWPNPVDILDRNSGELTLLFPNNRSFVRLKAAPENSSTPAPDMPAPPPMPAMPTMPMGVGAKFAPGAPTMPGMMEGMAAAPMMLPPMMEKMELRDTGQRTNLLGFACEQYELKQRGETMEIWATDQLFPFQPYVRNQSHRFGPRQLEDQWGDLLKAKKLFPLLAVVKFENGAERVRFKVQSITPEKIKADDEAKSFQPPPDYQEIQPLPF
jgi:hypothetical protein